jgi:AraC-like DNA-binding protein
MEARGILGPEAVGQQFTLQLRTPPADLASLIEHHWLVAWDLRGRADHTSEVLPHPSVHLVFEPTGAAVYGVSRPNLALTRDLARAMALAPPGARVVDIASARGISVRTVQRLFSEYVGVGPKWVLQRYRLHEALAQLHAGPDTDWAQFALGLGYYDQAHFVRDFRALVGRTPAQYERERRDSDHFSKLPRR